MKTAQIFGDWALALCIMCWEDWCFVGSHCEHLTLQQAPWMQQNIHQSTTPWFLDLDSWPHCGPWSSCCVVPPLLYSVHLTPLLVLQSILSSFFKPSPQSYASYSSPFFYLEHSLNFPQEPLVYGVRQKKVLKKHLYHQEGLCDLQH